MERIHSAIAAIREATMKSSTKYLMATMLGLVSTISAFAQSNATPPALFVAMDGAVTIQPLSGAGTIWWSTGPGLTAIQSSPPVSAVSGAGEGATFATPMLTAGTEVIVSTIVLPSFRQCPQCGGAMLTTGNPQGKNFFGGGPNPWEGTFQYAAVTFQTDNTALVGFPPTADPGQLSGSLNSLPTRFLVWNVSASIGSGGGCKN